MMKLGLALLVAGAVGACGGTSTGPISMPDAETECTTICEHEYMCDPGGETVEVCTADCVGDSTGVVREDVIRDYADCVADLACTMSSDTCLMECVPTSAHESYETHCRAKVMECGLPGSADGLCETKPNLEGGDVGLSCAFTPEIMREFDDCLSRECAAVPGCFATVRERYDIGF